MNMFRAPQVYYEADTVKNLKAELARGMKIKCTKCSLKGAALGCYVKSCRRSYHVPCAREMSRCRWDNVCAVTFSSAYINFLLTEVPIVMWNCFLGPYRKTFSCFVRLILQLNSQARSLDLVVVYLKLTPYLKGMKPFSAYYDFFLICY